MQTSCHSETLAANVFATFNLNLSYHIYSTLLLSVGRVEGGAEVRGDKAAKSVTSLFQLL